MTKSKKTVGIVGLTSLLIGGAFLLNEQTVEDGHSALYWEHDGLNTPGFVVEETTNIGANFYTIGFVSVTNRIATNFNEQFTYKFQLTNTQSMALYRVGAQIYVP